MPKVKVNDIEMYYEMTDFTNPWEKPETLVLIHGFPGNTKFWFQQVPAFSREFRVITLDNRGHGRTTIPQNKYTIKTMASDLKVLLDKLNINKAYLLGHSMGGCIAQQFALEYPEKVKGLVLVGTFSQPMDPPMDWNTLKPLFFTFGPDTLATLTGQIAFSSNVDKDLLEWTMTQIRNTSPYTLGVGGREAGPAESTFTFNVTAQLKNLKAPTLVTVGKDDVNVPPKFSEIIHKNIPNSKLVVMSGPHYCFLEYPDEFNKIVLEFLRKLKG